MEERFFKRSLRHFAFYPEFGQVVPGELLALSVVLMIKPLFT
jgi:hypothetical protein